MPAETALLSDEAVREWFGRLPVDAFAGKRVLVLVPDSTRTAPLPLLFDALWSRLAGIVKSLDVLIALGTHPPMSEVAVDRLLGITDRRHGRFSTLRVFNHEWDRGESLVQLGTLSASETREISGGLLSLDVPVRINVRVADYDLLLVLGPVFPHEVVGFSGGNKYFFPGISGPELLNFFHWLGAIITNERIIGVADTPVRRVVDRAASLIRTERRCIAFVVSPDARLHGIFYGTPESAWAEAAALSSRVHIRRVRRPYRQILSCAPAMYDELWVAGKCMYKLEPVVADGGELIIYVPHLSILSTTHGRHIERIGYHVRDYFTGQWDRFQDVPWGVLAHSTHVRGTGTYADGIERPRVKVTLASGIPPDVCERISLSYRDPATIDIESFADREDEGVLLVRKAGELLYRLEDKAEGTEIMAQSPADLKHRLEFALDVARQAGELILGYYQSESLAVEAKRDSSPVTAADREAEQLIRGRIEADFPGDGVLGEEFGESSSANGFRWILDPIDGTKSFIHGVPLFGTLIGLECQNRVIAGVCRFPALDEVVYAGENQGTWWQMGRTAPRRARVSQTADLSAALFCITTISGWERIGRYDAFERLRSVAQLTRGWGDCYGHALVATGRADVMVDPLMNAWDAAPFIPIMQEAGGHFLDWDGRVSIHSGNGLSVNHALKSSVLERLKPAS